MFLFFLEKRTTKRLEKITTKRLEKILKKNYKNTYKNREDGGETLCFPTYCNDFFRNIIVQSF
jgi:hypothetical protein